MRKTACAGSICFRQFGNEDSPWACVLGEFRYVPGRSDWFEVKRLTFAKESFMPKPFDFGGVNLTAGGDSSGARPSAETPFCIAVLGDFSGRANRRVSDARTIGKRRAVLVDRDNFDEVLSRSGAEIQLPMGESGSLRLRFSELEDFHPDRIFQRLEIFGKLRDLRARVQDPSTFQETAKELGLRSRDSVSEPRKPDNSPAVAPSAARLASGSLLDEMIEQTEARVATDRPRRSPDEVGEFAQRVVAQHLVNTPDPRQSEILAVIDRAIGGLMRAVLHSPDFQALEAVWRATFLLARQLETGSQLKLYLVDISKEELAADLSSAADLRDTGVYRLLVEKSVETQGAEPWAIIVGNYCFGSGSNDAEVLSRMARIAHRARAPFLAEASAHLLGCTSLASTPHPREWKAPGKPASVWGELRHLPEAEAVGLALPRFLLRLPYGKGTSSLESFDFEEFPDLPVHEDYLWGNPAFAVALLLAQSFSETGWQMRPGTATEIEKLPLHVYRREGESESKPCAEVLLTDDAAERMVEEGLIPLVSFKGRDSVGVVRFQSIADPPRALGGRWGN
jgi:type VI secretion system protein ImpC